MKYAIALIILLLCCAGTFFIAKSIYQKVEVPIVNIADSTKQAIIQQAIKGYISQHQLDSILANIPDKQKVVLRYYSVPRDSVVERVVIRDSVYTIPFYEAPEEEIANFTYDSTDYRVELSVAVRPSFFPTIELFSTQIGIKRLFVAVKQSPAGGGYSASTIGIFGGVENRFDENVRLFTGLKYYIIDTEYFQLYGSGEVDYLLRDKEWDGSLRATTELKF